MNGVARLKIANAQVNLKYNKIQYVLVVPYYMCNLIS